MAEEKVVNVVAQWAKGMTFVARADSGHAVVMDATAKEGGEDSAPRPMELLLISYAGCTAMDVIAILRKFGIYPDDFRVEISGRRRDRHPRHYREVTLKYILRGRNIPRERVERAVELSQNKFCSVTPMFKALADVKYEIIIDENALDR